MNYYNKGVGGWKGLDHRILLISDGNSDQVAHAGIKLDLFGEKKSIYDCSRSDQKQIK